MTNLRALCAWVIRWHVTCMLSLAEHWQGRRALSNHVCAHSVITMWHVVCLQLARACSEQSRSTTVLPINHEIQMPQCLSGFVNHDYYPKQLTPKRGSQSSLCLDPNLTWWAYGVISLLFRPGTFPAGGLISPLSSPAFDGAFDHLQLIRVTFIFKMQITLKTNKLCSY